MRRLMKGKRRKSESPSDAESEENGGNAHKSDDAEQMKPDDNDGESAPKSKRRALRGRDSNKPAINEITSKKDSNNQIDDNDDEDDDDDNDGNNNDDDENDDDDDGLSKLANHENGDSDKNGTKKHHKKKDQRATTSQEENDSDEEYEVEKIVSHKTVKGRRQFLIRWKGYEEEADTWEDESELNCSQLINEFLADKKLEQENGNGKNSQNSSEDNDTNDTENIVEKLKKTPKNKRPKTQKNAKKSQKTTKTQNNGDKMGDDENEDDEKQNADTRKKKKRTRSAKQQTNNAKKQHEEDNSDEEEKEYEVDKIIDVYFKKNKSREFLIRWKGFSQSDDTWEPEANLNCPELIAKFMEKVEKARATDLRELRTNPSHTKRYTLTVQSRGRRLSRRNAGKERTTYHECD